jgi:hypothetical protein
MEHPSQIRIRLHGIYCNSVPRSSRGTRGGPGDSGPTASMRSQGIRALCFGMTRLTD